MAFLLIFIPNSNTLSAWQSRRPDEQNYKCTQKKKKKKKNRKKKNLIGLFQLTYIIADYGPYKKLRTDHLTPA
jgi:hypothetical protein